MSTGRVLTPGQGCILGRGGPSAPCPVAYSLGRRRPQCSCRAFLGCAVAAPPLPVTTATGVGRARPPAPSLARYSGKGLGWRRDFHEHYKLLHVIGQGNFGTVWLACSRHDPGRHVAVKVLPKARHGAGQGAHGPGGEAAADPHACCCKGEGGGQGGEGEALAAIRREAAVWGAVSAHSRYVCALLGLYEDEGGGEDGSGGEGGSAYLVQQLGAGGDLGAVLKDCPLPESCVAAVMWCVLCAVRDCHVSGVALLDVKPHNMLLAGGGHVRQLRLDQLDEGSPPVVACDFGCSMPLDQLQRGGAKRGGSPAFFAPEQFTPCYGLPVDVWAAGVTMYLLLTGRYPFWEAQRAELEHRLPAYQVMLAVCSAPISFSGPELRAVSRPARQLLAALLERNPAARPTAQQALEHPWFAAWGGPAGRRQRGQGQQGEQAAAGHGRGQEHCPGELGGGPAATGAGEGPAAGAGAPGPSAAVACGAGGNIVALPQGVVALAAAAAAAAAPAADN